MEEDLYSIASASQVHYAGEILKGLDWEEAVKKGTPIKLPTQGKLLRLEVGQVFQDL